MCLSWYFWVLMFITSKCSQAVSPKQQQSVRLVNDKIYFQASSIETFFRDRSHLVFDNESIHFNSTNIGDLISFTYQDETQLREVRLYYIPPERDWRSNQTYQWKLTQSWISDNFYGYIFWNVNGYVDSDLRATDHLFQCEHVEFSYWHNAPRGQFARSEGRLVMKNVEMGAFLQDNFNESSFTRGNPCHGKGACRAIDGNVTCMERNYWRYGAIAVSSAVAFLFVVIASRASRTRQYRRVVVEDMEQDGLSNDGSEAEGENEPYQPI